MADSTRANDSKEQNEDAMIDISAKQFQGSVPSLVLTVKIETEEESEAIKTLIERLRQYRTRSNGAVKSTG